MYRNNITAAKFKLCNIKKFSLQSIHKHAEKRMNTYNSLLNASAAKVWVSQQVVSSVASLTLVTRFI